QLPARHAALTRRLRALLRRLRGQPAPIPEAVWDAAVRQGPWLSALPATRQARLRGLASAFLGRKTITPLGGLELDDAERCLLAALCCLPLLEFGEEGLHGWSQLLVYPEAFRVQRSHVDASGVLHEWHDELIGEAWESGPLVLSWADVQADCEDPRAGFCVAAHEMAHKLDALDGVLDGTPPLAAPVAAAVGAGLPGRVRGVSRAAGGWRGDHHRSLRRRGRRRVLRSRHRIPLQRSGRASHCHARGGIAPGAALRAFPLRTGRSKLEPGGQLYLEPGAA